MNSNPTTSEVYRSQLRVFLEEICCDLFRLSEIEKGIASDAVSISREAMIGEPGRFADIRIEAANQPVYFAEIKLGYPQHRLVPSIAETYGSPSPAFAGADRLILVIKCSDYDDWPDIEAEIRNVLNSDLTLEIWDESRLNAQIQRYFGVSVSQITADNLFIIREALDKARWKYAYSEEAEGHPLAQQLLWHLSPWTLRRAHELGTDPRELLSANKHENLVILMADICGYSSYVHDTHKSEVVSQMTSAFYSKARYEVMSAGGFFYQFVGDQIIGIFGMLVGDQDYVERALDCAQALVEVGRSVTNNWQRQISDVQATGGVHIALSFGDLNLVPLRPFSRRYVSFVGDAINIAARLIDRAGPDEIVVDSLLFRQLPSARQRPFFEESPIAAKNIGAVSYWKWSKDTDRGFYRRDLSQS